MKHLISVFCLLLFAAPVHAQDVRIDGIEIVRAGIYDMAVISTERDADGVLQHVANYRLIESTTSVPMRLGVTFGIEYRLIGEPGGERVTVRRAYRFPQPGGRPPGASVPLLTSSAPYEVTVNGNATASYTLEEPWELLSGIWVIEIWHGDHKLGEQAFTLVPEYAEAMRPRVEASR